MIFCFREQYCNVCCCRGAKESKLSDARDADGEKLSSTFFHSTIRAYLQSILVVFSILTQLGIIVDCSLETNVLTTFESTNNCHV